jgi:hypothetical protein
MLEHLRSKATFLLLFNYNIIIFFDILDEQRYSTLLNAAQRCSTLLNASANT